jgi:hypothetical protein
VRRAYGQKLWTGQARDAKARRMSQKDPDRERRLAEALRANLRKRKARAADDAAPRTDPQPPRG